MNLWDHLQKIKEFLEQIDAITQNQTTLIISDDSMLQNEEDILRFMEEMVQNKELIISELEKYEQLFEEEYQQKKEELIREGLIEELKKAVSQILQIKQDIVEHEKNNLMLMKSKQRSKPEKVIINPTADKVLMAYKKQVKKE